MAGAEAVMPVSVVLERRASNSQWQDHTWEPIGILPRSALPVGALMAEAEGIAQYHGGALDIELHRGETEGYLNNLSQTPPMVYVVLKKNEAGGDLEFAPFLATICPYEAMGYAETDSETLVDGVPMPPAVLAWVQEFVATYYVETPFIKRKNKRHQDKDKQPPIAPEGGMS